MQAFDEFLALNFLSYMLYCPCHVKQAQAVVNGQWKLETCTLCNTEFPLKSFCEIFPRKYCPIEKPTIFHVAVILNERFRKIAAKNVALFLFRELISFSLLKPI